MDGSSPLSRQRQEVESAVVRFAGDSGDGMQLSGAQFTLATALAGNDLATFPDFPAEIRAPVGTTFGVSAYQINFGAREIRTAGDEVEVLVAMNPAALKVNLSEVKRGGLLILDSSSFTKRNLAKAGYESDPREDLSAFRLLEVDITGQTERAVAGLGLSKKEAQRCKNFWALGLIYWLFERERQATVAWLEKRFARRPELVAANRAALDAGHAWGETAELPSGVSTWRVPRAQQQPGTYRNVTGAQALSWGLLAGAQKAGLGMSFCGYPITPASVLLHTLAGLKEFGVVTFQAEDEIAAICAAIGASYAGSLGVTASSGPGLALKMEAMGLAIATELPLVVINAQRGGPSTGLPTKTEQSDLYQAVWGRNGDAPVAVLASRSPADCFEVALEAIRIATTWMTPVILLTDGYLQNASEPWRLPAMSDYPDFPVTFRTRAPAEGEVFQPYARDRETLARAWVRPGTPGLEHRIGGLERDALSGHISYDPDNHQAMTDHRAEKIAGIAGSYAPLILEQGEGEEGDLLVVGWGSTWGPISRAVANLRASGQKVGQLHLRHIWPLHQDLGPLLHRWRRIAVPEMNAGQLVTLLRATYLVEAEAVTKASGRPFKVAELEARLGALLPGGRLYSGAPQPEHPLPERPAEGVEACRP